MKTSRVLLTIVLLTLLSAPILVGHAGSFPFTYQGQLTGDGAPANGDYDFQFTLYDAPIIGYVVAGPITKSPVGVTNGLFTTELDFGPGAFPGEARWLEIQVRPHGGDAWTVLSPLQQVTPTPYASQLVGALAGPALEGTYGNALSFTNAGNQFHGSFTGDGSGLLGLSLTNLTIGAISDAMLSANVALRLGGNVFGGNQIFSSFVGIGTGSPTQNLHVVGNVRVDGAGVGISNPGLGVANANPNGIGIFSTTTSSDANLVVVNKGEGDILKGFSGANGGELVFEVKNTGNVRVNAAGAGLDDPGLRVGNRGANGIGILSAVNSADACLVLGNEGSGEIIKGFSGPNGGDLVFQVKNAGNVRVDGTGAGLAEPSLWVGNRDPDGIGIFSTVSSSDANLVLVNEGGGGIMKGFGGPGGSDLVFSVNGSGYVYCQDELTCNSLEIRGGADLAEPFALTDPAIQPGAVVVIDEDHPGQLKLSTRAYDTAVAGIVSGAGGVKPGISMIQQGALAPGKNVALSGRVFALVDASAAPVRPGDLLTTSDTPGHAMKATDRTKAQGAILGKAMSRLETGRGLVLVLVSLQ